VAGHLLHRQDSAITGKLNRIPGQGMIRESFTKTEAGMRVLPLPAFAITMLMGRQVAALGNLHDVVFPSALGAPARSVRRAQAAAHGPQLPQIGLGDITHLPEDAGDPAGRSGGSQRGSVPTSSATPKCP
jgi:hypothetical protein